ncbi:glycosyltransferase family 2 protein [Ralstonia soli]|uniref:Glycosyltransferase family 2 protein n=1 Tax=Ralstonia soli TaxID=2953896 RepID=A0ABT1APN6_9RALS|nr:glycosyltransferase family 2 protein [Ralstonia soli]MCO5400271.1 glycosyltransferase family 2 protein [Ralstonia soli]
MSKRHHHGPYPSLALVVIARNEAGCIQRCLMSAKPYVDRLVVLDTGSTDDTVAIAQACGAEVGHFTWIDDFSAARNAALVLANSDWNLVMDADEWIESGGEHLRSLCTATPYMGEVCISSHTFHEDIKIQANSQIIRLLPRGVRYERRVHEQPVAPLVQKRVPIVFGHDGYTDEKVEKKRGRNTALLLKELVDHPTDPYVLFQFGKDLEQTTLDFTRAADYYARALELTAPNAPYRHNLCMRLLFSLNRAGQLDTAITRAGEWMDEWAESPDFFYQVGILMTDASTKYPDQALSQWLPMAEQAFLRCLEIGDRPNLDDSTLGVGSHFAAERLADVHQRRSHYLANKAHYYLTLAEELKRGAATTPSAAT